MNVTFYILLGFIFGVTLICAMIIVVSCGGMEKREVPEISRKEHDPKKVAYSSPPGGHHTYDASGQKRRVVNVKYRDPGRSA